MIRLLLLLTFFFHTLHAEKSTYPFIGITSSLQTIDFQPIVTAAPNRLNNPASKDSNTFGIQYGVQTRDYRTTFSYENTNDFQTLDVGVDYIFMDDIFGTSKARPYIGATIGYLMYDESTIVDYNENTIALNEAKGLDTTVSTSDGYYGLDAGFIFYVTDSIDLDIGYHYYFVDRLAPLNTMSGFSFSLHYFY